MTRERLGSLWFPFRGQHLDAAKPVLSEVEGLHVMLWAVDWLPFLRGVRRFSTPSHPDALDACYVAAWPLPRPDSHRLADDSLSGHTVRWLGCQCTYSSFV